MKSKITIQIDYANTDMSSYQIYDWIEKTFGDKEVKPLTEEIRTSDGTLTHIEFIIMEDVQTAAFQNILARWKDGYAFNEDSDEDVALLQKAEDELSKVG